MSITPLTAPAASANEETPSRPRLYGVEARTRAVEASLDDIENWWASKGLRFAKDDQRREGQRQLWADLIVEVMGEMIEPYAQTKWLEARGWRADADLVFLLDGIRRRLRFAWRGLIAEWVVRHGVRFPAVKDDVIAFKDSTLGNGLHKGRVLSVFSDLATALVAYPVDAASPTKFEVIAEAVAARSTEGRRAIETTPVRPMVGFQKANTG